MPVRISRAAYTFVAVLFCLLGGSFIASTVLLLIEFRDSDWQTMLFAHSHLFFFFPVFGCVALLAFFIPSVVFTDLYWQHLTHGLLRYTVGLVVVLGTSAVLMFALDSPTRRGIWEISPKALQLDQAARPEVVANCRTDKGAACYRQPLLQTLQRVRDEGMKRSTITEFARVCKPDPLLERPATDTAIRYCFPANAMMDADNCCRVQQQFAERVHGLFQQSSSRSTISMLETWLTGCKVFFVIVLVVISGMLIFWGGRLTTIYAKQRDAVERGVIIGAVVMLLWLLMDYGYQQTSNVMFGREQRGLPFRWSLVVAAWAPILLLYFLKRSGEMMINAAQMSTIAASGIAVFNYELIGNAAARLLGSGAEWWIFAGLGFVALLALQLLYGPWKLPLPTLARKPVCRFEPAMLSRSPDGRGESRDFERPLT